MPALATPAAVIVVDVGTTDPDERRAMVFQTFATLAPGQTLELVSDHDPEPLRKQFAAELPGQFGWQREQGPINMWRVLIVKPDKALV